MTAPDNPPDWRGPSPPWDDLPPTMTSIEAARLLQIQPKSLSKYVQRGEMAQPIERGTNHAIYRTDDVRALWDKRQLRKAQGYIKDKPPTVPADDPATGIVSTAIPPMTDLVTLDRAGLSSLLSQAVAEGVRAGSEPLIVEVAALREELAAIMREAQESAADSEKPPTQPPTKSFWRRLFGA